MSRRLFIVPVIVACMLMVSCGKREQLEEDAGEWSDIQALGDGAQAEPAAQSPDRNESVEAASDTAEVETEPLIRLLKRMKSAERASGETVMTGESLELDYEDQLIRMDHNIVITDDQGTLETERLTARFTDESRMRSVLADGGVTVRNEGRTATAEKAVYDVVTGAIEFEGRAMVDGKGIRISGERIIVEDKGNRRLICEPNARLLITDASDLPLGEWRNGTEWETEIRADKAVFDESADLVELEGHVRLRDAHVVIDCGKVRVHLKETREISWIEALNKVIIKTSESGGAKALAERAVYTVAEGRFLLEGNPMVQSGGNVLTGDRISFWHKTEQMVCEPNARVVLYLDEETKARFRKDLDN